jgi:uncharacterized membrane protein
MNVVLWIVQGLLAVLYLFAGGTKMVRSKEQLAGTMGWVESYSPGAVKAIGAVEVLGAIGLILPWATGIAEVLTPLAAVGLAVVQILAAVVHVRRKENKSLPVNALLFLLAAFVAVGRFVN